MNVAWRRLAISPDTHPSLGANIQGPSVIRTPSWVEDPLGTYLCYFADHKGDHIRLAYADEVSGPWSVVPGGCLSLDESKFLTETPEVTLEVAEGFRAAYDEEFDGYEVLDLLADLTIPHIASPDVRVNHELGLIEMWFHGLAELGIQTTRYASSVDGVNFEVDEPTFDGTYLRMFQVDGRDYGLAMPGEIVRRSGGPVEFERGPRVLSRRSRHMAAWVSGDELRIFYSDVGDAPERIKMVVVDVSRPWPDWKSGEPIEVIAPVESWEGADEANVPSIRSYWHGPANQLRDPFVFVDDCGEGDGEAYLFYAVAGESGIGVAKL